MLHFGVTIPVNLPQWSKIPEGLTNYHVFCTKNYIILNVFTAATERQVPSGVNVWPKSTSGSTFKTSRWRPNRSGFVELFSFPDRIAFLCRVRMLVRKRGKLQIKKRFNGWIKVCHQGKSLEEFSLKSGWQQTKKTVDGGCFFKTNSESKLWANGVETET
jgi:hypothetical protein